MLNRSLCTLVRLACLIERFSVNQFILLQRLGIVIQTMQLALGIKRRENQPICLKMPTMSCQRLLAEYSCQTQAEEMVVALKVDRSSVAERVQTVEIVEQASNWIPY